jgi:hypothetical protein
MDITLEQLQTAHDKAIDAAENCGLRQYKKHGDNGLCGFAWVRIEVDGRSKLAKMLKKIGYQKSWRSGELILWNPSKTPVQSLDIKEEATLEYIQVFTDMVDLRLQLQTRLDLFADKGESSWLSIH